MPVLAAFMVPHPPMIVPEIGRGSEKQITETIRAYEQVAGEIAALQPETIIISSPHSVLYADYFHISPGKGATGDFGRFGASRVSFRETYDTELAERICGIAKEKDFPAGMLGERDKRLDHGTMVPLFFMEQRYRDFRLIRIGLSGLSLADHYAFGQIIRQAVEETGRRTFISPAGICPTSCRNTAPTGLRLRDRTMTGGSWTCVPAARSGRCSGLRKASVTRPPSADTGLS